jgi:hypothetical protein
MATEAGRPDHLEHLGGYERRACAGLAICATLSRDRRAAGRAALWAARPYRVLPSRTSAWLTSLRRCRLLGGAPLPPLHAGMDITADNVPTSLGLIRQGWAL